MNKNNLQPNQPSSLAALSLAASSEMNHSLKRNLAFSLAESATHVAHCKDFRKVAFTLAEVLITLAIIGVVAALTLPSVINNYKRKQLHTAFLRSSSMIQNALNQTASEYGYTNYKELNSICEARPVSQTDKCISENKDLFTAINNDFLSRFSKLKKDTAYYFNYRGIKIYPYGGAESDITIYGNAYGLYSAYNDGLYYLTDGSAITGITFFHHGKYDGISLTFDTNGPKKGPNRYGYDVFLFNTGTWAGSCSKTVSPIPAGTSRGCYDYALKDINPDDKTKKYWDSLEF